jgi:predicted ATPase/class 3 adenylate cyclase
MKNLIPHFIAEQFTKGIKEGSFNAVTMFMDISGFTAMTERLMQEGKEGAEILSRILNSVFTPLVAVVGEKQGFISAFAGDSFTAIFPAEDYAAPVLAALAIQKLILEKGMQKTKFGDFEITVKVGLSFGRVDWGIIGNQTHKTYYFSGEAIDGCASAEHQCAKMEIVVTQNLLELLPDNDLITVKIVQKYAKLIRFSGKSKPAVKLTEKKLTRDLLTFFMPDKVLDLRLTGEFREIVSVFISLQETELPITEMITAINQECVRFGGYFNRVDFGDKGCVIVIFFGAPVSYEDNTERALDFILKLKEKYTDSIRSGITKGIAYAGFVGSQERCDYTCLGNVVNVSARFMMIAEFGQIWLSKTLANSVISSYEIRTLGYMTLKGKAKAVEVFELLEKKTRQSNNLFSGKIVGREAELQKLQELCNPILNHSFGGIVYVYGEAGIGKSRLVFEAVEQLKPAIEIYTLQADSILKNSLNPFVYFFKAYFNQNSSKSEREQKIIFEKIYADFLAELQISSYPQVSEMFMELKRTKSFIGALSGLHWEESLFEQLEPRLRFENMQQAIKNFMKALSLLKPVVFIIEDLHWLDHDSKEMVKMLCRNVNEFPFIMIATSRLHDDGSKPRMEMESEIPVAELEIEELPEAAIGKCIENQLNGQADKQLHDFILNKSHGNPFYIEQYCLYLLENNLLALKNGIYRLVSQKMELPSGINAVLIARIDRLSSDLKETVQTASVLGREVDITILRQLINMLEKPTGKSDFDKLIEQAAEEQIWTCMKEITYIFKHALLHEAIYEMQLKESLKKLHQLAAEVLENSYSDKEEMATEIAMHFHKAEQFEKAVKYYEKAGNWFAKNYQNEKAIECYDYVLEHLDEEKDWKLKIEVLRSRAHVLMIIGEIEKSKDGFIKALSIANNKHSTSEIMKIYSLLGKLSYFERKYIEGKEYFEKALNFAIELNDTNRMTSILGNIGAYYHYTNDLDKAKEFYEKQLEKAHELNLKSDEAIALANIGMVYINLKNYNKAILYFEQAKAKSIFSSDLTFTSYLHAKIGEIKFRTGELKLALECFEEELKCAQKTGSKSDISFAINHIGHIYHEMNDFPKALEYYEMAKKIKIELGDKRGLLRTVFNMALIYNNKDEYIKSEEYFKHATELALEMNIKGILPQCWHEIAYLKFNDGLYDESKEANNRAKCYASEEENSEIIFSCTILSHKLRALENPEEAISLLSQMLETEKEEVNLATLHYEIYQINDNHFHGKEALKLYKKLYANTPNIEFKKRIDELIDILCE